MPILTETWTLGTLNTRLLFKQCGKKQSFTESVLYAFVRRFLLFCLDALGAVFLIFAGLETGLKIDGFSGVTCQNRAGGGATSRPFWAV